MLGKAEGLKLELARQEQIQTVEDTLPKNKRSADLYNRIIASMKDDALAASTNAPAGLLH